MQTLLHSVILHLLRPLIRILHRQGVSFGEFSQIARKVYVETAEAALQDAGEKATTSRIAITTGLTRKDVAQLRQTEASAGVPLARYNRSVRVISAWMSDVDFQGANGAPAELPLQGSENTFEQLVNRYSGDMPYRAMLKELEQNKVVQLTESGMVRLLTNAYIPQDDDVEKLSILGSDVALLINTIDHNLQPQQAQPHFQRKVSYDNLPIEAANTFKHMVNKEGMALLLRFNEWLAQHDRDSNPEVKGDGKMRAGVGIYYFETPLEPTPRTIIKDSDNAS